MSRLVPQQIAQMVWCSAGQARRGFRVWHKGQDISSVSHYNFFDFSPKLCRNTLCTFPGASAAPVYGRNMAEALVRNESPTEYFKELVETAMEHQHVAVRDLTSFYLVNLLTGFVHFDRSAANAADEPLGIRFARALQAGGSRQRDGLREVGDLSLFISGFFADSLTRSLVDVDYYIQLGERAYGSLARHGDPALGDVFDELAGEV